MRRLRPNTILNGRYKIMGVLGGENLSIVFQARDLESAGMKKLVVVKEIQLASSNAAYLKMAITGLQKSAILLAALDHPNIIKIMDFFDIYDCFYLVMNYINGSDLEMLVSKTKAVLPVGKVVEWAIDMCSALEYLHSQQPEPIVYSDLKSAHIMIDSLGRTKLMIPIPAMALAPTAIPVRIGTEGYAAPELYARQITPLTDIYSLGATLHHTLTRSDPRLESPFSFLERPIKQYNPNVPDALVEIIEKAVQFDPKDRWLSAAEMKAALESL